jgi:hypothetical protein
VKIVLSLRESVLSVTSVRFSVSPVERMAASSDAAVSLRRLSVGERRWVVEESDASAAESDSALTPSDFSLLLGCDARAESVDAATPRGSSRAKSEGYEPSGDVHLTTSASAVTTSDFPRPASDFPVRAMDFPVSAGCAGERASGEFLPPDAMTEPVLPDPLYQSAAAAFWDT